MATRLDRATLNSARYDENGYMYDSPVLTRTGVFDYRDADGSIRREYRPPEEVFNQDSLNTYSGKPFTVEHQKVNAKNARGNVIGTVMSAGREDGTEGKHRLLRADVVLHDPAIIKAGWKDISVGYSVDLDETPGTSPEGEKYDAIQRNIRVNHVAIVPKGRAGVSKFNVDRADAVSVDITVPLPGGDDDDDKGDGMSKIRLDNNLEYDAAPEVVHAFEQVRKDADDARKSVDTEKARADSAEAKLKKAEEEKEQIRKDAAADARRHVQLETVAKAQGVTVRDDASPRDLQVAIIKAVRGDSFDVEGKPDSYIDAACDIAISDIEDKARNDAAGRQRALTTPPASAPIGTPAGDVRNDKQDLAAARAGMRQRRNDSFKATNSAE